MIPNDYLFVWTGNRFPYHARLAVESLLLKDADARVKLCVFGPSPAEAPHFQALTRYARVEVVDVDLHDIFTGLDVDAGVYVDLLSKIPKTAYSAQSNLVRLGLLHRYGGIYLDFDILIMRSLEPLRSHEAFIGQELVWRVDEHRVAGELRPWMVVPTVTYVTSWLLHRADAALGGRNRLDKLTAPLDANWSTTNLNNAVIGAQPGNSFIRRCLVAAREASPEIRYDLGPSLVSRVAAADSSDVTIMPPEAFFLERPSYSFHFFLSEPYAVPDETFLLHYVSSNHGDQLRGLDAEAIVKQRDRALFYQVAAEVIEGAKALPTV